MRVLISGGGVAGLTLAYWLHRYHIPVVVIEQAEHLRQDGYGLDFYGTGYDVAERMGILESLRQQQIPVESISYVMRPYVEKRQKNARSTLKAFIPESKPGTVAQQLFMKLVLREAFSGLLVRQFGAESLLRAPHSV